VHSQKSEQLLFLQMSVRSLLVKEIGVANTSQSPQEYSVVLEGTFLDCERQFVVRENSTYMFALAYLPLAVGQMQGKLGLVCREAGETWYNLEMVCIPFTEVLLPAIKAEIGKMVSHQIALSNPAAQDALVTATLSLPHNFFLEPKKFRIKAGSGIVVNVEYVPSSLSVEDKCDLHFESEEIGSWQYHLVGQGLPPTPLPLQTISARINSLYSGVVNFHNPFHTHIKVLILVEGSEQARAAIQLLEKDARSAPQQEFVLNGLSSIKIPYLFLPKDVCQYEAQIVVQLNDKVRWVYPLKGVVEWRSEEVFKQIRVLCRESMEENVRLVLPGVGIFFAIIFTVDERGLSVSAESAHPAGVRPPR